MLIRRHGGPIVWLLAAALLLSGCFALPTGGVVSGTVSFAGYNYCGWAGTQAVGLPWLPFDAEELVVRFHTGISPGRAAGLLKSLGLEIVDYNDVLDAYLARSADRLALLRAYEVLQRHGSVRSVEPNRVFTGLAVEPADPEYGRQRWHFEMANIPEAWAAGHTGSDTVIVAVLDGGFQMDHPDMGDARWYKPYDAFTRREGPLSDDGPPGALAHGTHVAGIIGALTNNGAGGAGVAWDVRIMPVRVLRWRDGAGGTGYMGTLDVVATGVRWAVDNGAHIINMSLGTEAGLVGALSASALAEELERAYRRGVTVIAAAGNSGDASPFFPACDPRVISVGALYPGPGGPQRAWYSSYGPHVTLFAPGGGGSWDVWSANRTAGPEYQGSQGTSMAAPHVAGVAALLHAAGVTEPERIKAALCLGAARGSGLGAYDAERYGPCGFLDAFGALTVADPPGLEDVRVLLGRREGSAFAVQQEVWARPQGGFTVQHVPTGVWDVLAWVPRSGGDTVQPGDLAGWASVYVSGTPVGGQRIVLEPVPAGADPVRIQR